jgi:integrase/recombinase XerD
MPTKEIPFLKAKIRGGHSHRLRDTFAVGLLQGGVSIENVARLLGHGSIRITEKHHSPWVKARQETLEREVYRVHEVGTDFG